MRVDGAHDGVWPLRASPGDRLRHKGEGVVITKCKGTVNNLRILVREWRE
jgi:hypothetical protein